MKWVLLAIGLIMMVFVGFAIEGANDPEIQGLEACKDRIRVMSKNPARVDFGHYRSIPEYTIDAAGKYGPTGIERFTWERSELQMQNGFGAMLGVRAVCTYDGNTRSVSVEFND